MSYRELRNFSEMMRALGYQRSVSIDGFRGPNFALVADILFWLAHRFDPTAELSDDIGTPEARVEFLRNVGNVFLQRAHVRVSLKQLYRADGFAVKELLKVVSLLYEALRAGEEKRGEQRVEIDPAAQSKMLELRAAQGAASEIVESGARVHELLGREETTKRARDAALQFLDSMSMNLDSNDSQKHIEAAVRQQINVVTDNIASLERLTADQDREQAALLSKIERKDAELERAEKRVRSLAKVRPAFMDEYERLQAELRVVYEAYIERHRNLSFLEAELDKFHRAEREKKAASDRALRRMQKRLREEELRILRGEAEDASGAGGAKPRGGGSAPNSPPQSQPAPRRPSAATRARQQQPPVPPQTQPQPAPGRAGTGRQRPAEAGGRGSQRNLFQGGNARPARRGGDEADDDVDEVLRGETRLGRTRADEADGLDEDEDEEDDEEEDEEEDVDGDGGLGGGDDDF